MKREFDFIRTLDPEGTKVPAGISAYVKTHFRESFQTIVRPFAAEKGQKRFMVDVNHENSLYHFTFDSAGMLLHSSGEALHELYLSDVENS